MRLKTIWLVYRKELVETLRDRRTLIVMVLLPLALYPLIGMGVSEWILVQHEAREERPSRVAFAADYEGELARRLRVAKQIALRSGRGGEAAVRAGQLDAALVVPPDLDGVLAGDGAVRIEVLYDETRDGSRLAHKRLNEVLGSFSDEIVRRRLSRLSLQRSVVSPLDVRAHDLATAKELGGHLLGRILPLLVVLMVLLGAFYPAIDLTAGEKERGTLETLLCAPVPRSAIVAGKFLVVATIATVTGLLNLGSMGLTFGLGFRPALEQAAVAVAIPWTAIAMTAIAMLPAALFFAAVMIAIAALARSFKEAQTLLTPVYLVCLVPAMLVQLPGFELNAWTALVPAVNVALLTGRLITRDVPLLPALLTCITTVIYAGLALRLAAHIYSSERLLFSEGRQRRRRRGRPRRERPEPMHAGIVLLVVVVLIALVGRMAQARELISGVLLTEWLLIAGPVLLAVYLGGYAPRAVLGLRPPGARGLGGAALAGSSGWYLIGVAVETVQQRFMPMPRRLAEEMRRTLFAPSRPLALDLAALAVSPAICEELLFRGFLWRATLRDEGAGPGEPGLSPLPAVLVNAVLFGLFHFSVYRFFSTALLGAVLALLALRTRSIYPGMLFHALNNGAALIAGRLLSVKGRSLRGFSLPALGVSAVCFVAGLALALGRQRPIARGSGSGDRDANCG